LFIASRQALTSLVSDPTDMKFLTLYALWGLRFALSASNKSINNLSATGSVKPATSTSTAQPTLPIPSSASIRSAAPGLASSQVRSAFTAKTTSTRIPSSAQLSASTQGVSSARGVSTLRTITTTRRSTILLSTGGSISSSLKSSSILPTLTRSTASPSLPTDSNSPRIPPQGSGGICGGSPNGCWGNFSIETDSENTWPTTGRTVEVCDRVRTMPPHFADSFHSTLSL